MRAAGLIVLALALLGAAAVLAAAPGDAERRVARAAPRPAAPAATPQPEPEPPPPAPDVVMVRHRDGVPVGWASRLRRTAGVETVTRVARGQALLRAASGGRRVPAGHAVLLDLLAVEPRGYARMLPADTRAAFARLRPGTALLSATSARVRRLGAGGRLTLAGGRRLRVVAVVPDGLVRAAEVVVHRADGARLGARRPYLLAVAADLAAVRRAIAREAGGRQAATRPGGQNPRSRLVVVGRLGPAPWDVAGTVARPARLKARFGEPALRLPVGADWVTLDAGFRSRQIVTRSVPVLGTVTCHRRMIAPLRSALAELRRRGLSRLVDPGDYAGCYAPRRIPGSGSLSLHAWGLAVDLNAAANPAGGRSHQDRRLVRIMERHGFRWGGRWPTAPDPMHFEYHGD